ncbi:dihydrofolate reductase [Xylocopilactobacillus apicola]|uniref:dihydrofolate reductase n=1 Tax=Xylocopilactobacillus apicola TaxID=2932184 RepID=A0AAU9DRR1_9LACO|nr:dihydrofolate reductase [Xylocopilactobacillus apicola]BDR58654.1 dihydrofolate reductase [Xylocopilactobacillus apicola]
MICLIWAQDLDGVIGNSKTNQLPWPRMPEDLAYFKENTTGQIVVMGRKTFESLPNGPLKDRTNVVLTKKKLPEVITIKNLSELQLIQANNLDQNIFIIGGVQMYQATLPLAKRIYRTIISGHFSGDLIMPEIDKRKFETIYTKSLESLSGFSLKFEVLQKIKDSNTLKETSKNCPPLQIDAK